MGSISPEEEEEGLLDLRLSSSSKPAGVEFLRDTAGVDIGGGTRAVELEEIVSALEDERRKIAAFKRELPLCMLLLCDVIRGMKDELEQCRSGYGTAAVKMRRSPEEEKEGGAAVDFNNKRSWAHVNNRKAGFLAINGAKVTKPPEPTWPELSPAASLRGGVGDPPRSSFLSLSCSSSDNAADRAANPRSSERSGAVSPHAEQPPPPRKSRRCWSPELHRRFIYALQQLGGFRVATPKQIREVMRVSGLTNDEVKSHLQKYRLHAKTNAPTNLAAPVEKLPAAGCPWSSRCRLLLAGGEMSLAAAAVAAEESSSCYVDEGGN